MTALIIIILAIIALFLFLKIRKIPKLGSMTLVNGGIKTGKSTLSVFLAYRTYKKNHRIWKIKEFFRKIFKPKNKPIEEPLLYSNIPLKIPYVPLTKDLLNRTARFNYKSVVYICEASLIADSQLIKDKVLNEKLLLFNKLFAHETRGGSIFYDTQSISDLHYSIKRSLSSYLYIHHTFKYCPVFLLMWVQEYKYNDDGTVINTVQGDLEDNQFKLIIVPKSVWKKFDCYCYSSMTDNLPVENKKKVAVVLKVEDLVSFKEFISINKEKNIICQDLRKK